MTVSNLFQIYFPGSNSLVGKLIREGSPEVKMTMEILLEDGIFQTEIDEQIVFDQIDYSQSAIWSLLLANGYLRVESHEMLPGGRWQYGLKLTNREVRLMFERMIEGGSGTTRRITGAGIVGGVYSKV